MTKASSRLMLTTAGIMLGTGFSRRWLRSATIGRYRIRSLVLGVEAVMARGVTTDRPGYGVAVLCAAPLARPRNTELCEQFAARLGVSWKRGATSFVTAISWYGAAFLRLSSPGTARPRHYTRRQCQETRLRRSSVRPYGKHDRRRNAGHCDSSNILLRVDFEQDRRSLELSHGAASRACRAAPGFVPG